MAEKYYVEVDGSGNTYWYAWPGTERTLHRLGGPAVEQADGYRAWYQNGRLHRLDGPALEGTDGRREWHQNGRLHRLDGPAVDYPNYRAWWQNGHLYRVDGPAIELASGRREWYQSDQLHRTDGPAVECADGTYEWWLNGTQYTEDAWRAATQPSIEMTIAEIEAVLGKRIKIVK